MKKSTLIAFAILLTICSCRSDSIDSSPQFIDSSWNSYDPENCHFGQALDLVAPYKDQLWILGRKSFVRYFVDSGKCEEYNLDNNLTDALPLDLFVDSANNLWAVGVRITSINNDAQEGNWILWRHDQSSDKFISIKDIEENLYNNLKYSFDIAEGNDGTIWLLGANEQLEYTLISYNPKTNHSIIKNMELAESLQKLSLSPDYIYHIANDQNGQIWMSVADKGYGIEDYVSWKVISVNPKNNKIKNYGAPPGDLHFPPPVLFVDSNGRLLTSAIAWLDFGYLGRPSWSPVVRPSELVIRVNSPDGFSWEPPDSFYQTSDGHYWILSPSGLTTYDPESNLWRRISTTPYPVVEDLGGRVWYAGDSQIYLLNPTD